MPRSLCMCKPEAYRPLGAFDDSVRFSLRWLSATGRWTSRMAVVRALGFARRTRWGSRCAPRPTTLLREWPSSLTGSIRSGAGT
jgi:hypothetical protein